MFRATRASRTGKLPRAAASHFGAFVAGAAIATAAFAHAVPGERAADRGTDEAIHTFAEALRHIDRYYVEPVDQEEMVRDAITAMTEQLDAGSDFLPPSEYRRLREDTDGRYSGIGVSLEADAAGLGPAIAKIVAGSPAARAGLSAGDRIRSVEGVAAAALGDRAARRFENLLRGPAGRRVDLRVVSGERERALELTMEPIASPSVEWTIADVGDTAGVGIVAIERFHEGTAREVARALGGIARAQGYPLPGVVLDLRGNPGGLLDASIDVADLFVDRGALASVRGRRGALVSQWQAHGPGTFADVPLIVLIDSGSASAAEILAGSLQDHGRAVIAGTSSYGKGSVQTLFDLPGGSGLRLTTSHYYTPAERAIGADGLTPDIRLAEDVARARVPGGLTARWQRDAALLWAVEMLGDGRGELAVRGAKKGAAE